MANTEQILKAAKEVGKLVSSHETTKKFKEAVSGLQEDTDAQRLLTDYHRHLSTVGEKERSGKPIEVVDKRKLEDLQSKVAQHPLLRNLQMVQMDYLDLMRQIDEAIGVGPKPVDTPVVSSPVANPDATGSVIS